MNVERAKLPCADCEHEQRWHCTNDYPENEADWYPMCVHCMNEGRTPNQPGRCEFVMPILPLWVRDVAVLV